jgi:hypothetical protein
LEGEVSRVLSNDLKLDFEKNCEELPLYLLRFTPVNDVTIYSRNEIWDRNQGVILILHVRRGIIANMKDRFEARRRQTPFCAVLMVAQALFCVCASPGQVAVNTTEGRLQKYPPVIEDTPQRRHAAFDAWNKLLAEFQLRGARLELEAALNTARSLPLEMAGRMRLQAQAGEFGELEAKEALQRFIERASGIIFPNQMNGSANGPAQSSVSFKDLSLISFANSHNVVYRAVYRQSNYPFPIAGAYGFLKIAVDKNGMLSQLNSRIIPAVDLPTRAEIAPQSLIDKMVGREFRYSDFGGKPMSYKVANRSEVSVKDLVVYPKLEGNRITVHLAYPVEAGRGTTWTVYVDAITGQEIDVMQNFRT